MAHPAPGRHPGERNADDHQRIGHARRQRPYVWNEENQWKPLWSDVVRLAERILRQPDSKHHPHFLGAVVLQQVQKPTGLMQERTIIDGQQRLTTLQLLLHALEHFSIRLGVPRVREISVAFFFGNTFEKRGDCCPKLINCARLHLA